MGKNTFFIVESFSWCRWSRSRLLLSRSHPVSERRKTWWDSWSVEAGINGLWGSPVTPAAPGNRSSRRSAERRARLSSLPEETCQINCGWCSRHSWEVSLTFERLFAEVEEHDSQIPPVVLVHHASCRDITHVRSFIINHSDVISGARERETYRPRRWSASPRDPSEELQHKTPRQSKALMNTDKCGRGLIVFAWMVVY